MTAETDITAINDGGANTALEVRSALTSVLARADTDPFLTTKGDLLTHTTGPARLGVGANDTVLTADSAEPSGVKWATPVTGGYTLLGTTTAAGTEVTLDVTFADPAGTYRELYAVFEFEFSSSATSSGTIGLLYGASNTHLSGTSIYQSVVNYGAAGSDSEPGGWGLIQNHTFLISNSYIGEAWIHPSGQLARGHTSAKQLAGSSAMWGGGHLNDGGTLTYVTGIRLRLDGVQTFDAGSYLSVYGVK